MKKEDYTFTPDDEREGADDIKRQFGKSPEELREAIKQMILAIAHMKSDEPDDHGDLEEGTVCKVMLDEDEPNSVGLGLIVRDWYKEQGEDGTVTRNGKRYEVALFNQHKMVFTTSLKKMQIDPIFDNEKIAELAGEHHPQVLGIIASLLAGIRSEQKCPGCSRKKRKDDDD